MAYEAKNTASYNYQGVTDQAATGEEDFLFSDGSTDFLFSDASTDIVFKEGVGSGVTTWKYITKN